MKMFDYSELIRVIDNAKMREDEEKNMGILNLKARYEILEYALIKSGVLDDWNRLKKLCSEAGIRLCVSHIGDASIGCVLNHEEDFCYCNVYADNGMIQKLMSSGSHWSDYYGFIYHPDKGLIWQIKHTTSTSLFDGFNKDEELKYTTKIYLLETFRDTYEDYRNFQLKKVEEKWQSRIKPIDIIR